jgi:hypothetical protein
MLSSYEASGYIDGKGRLHLEDERAFSRAMSRFGRGVAVTVGVQEFKANRTVQQNRYYRLVLSWIAEHTGDDPEYLHEFFKKRFNTIQFSFAGEDETIGGSTARLDYDAFWQYVERVRQFALEKVGVVTPDPDPGLRRRCART